MATLSGCRTCQRVLLDTFVTFAGVTLAPSRAQTQTLTRRAPSHFKKKAGALASTARKFHTSINRPQQQQTLTNRQNELDSTPTEQPPSTTSATDSNASIPWYLRVANPTPILPQSLPNLALQEIPPLPTDPPPILQPILVHLSISIGLDALTILDLRGLNPPSALGSNLIMILGTARSEKHLNTSADRFCRWLRTTYKLRPYADGLLGRNELKLKLRRRNKKIKLAQSVGNTMYDADKGYDDGITTGWVCCNLGSVDVAMVADQNNDSASANPITSQDNAVDVQPATATSSTTIPATDSSNPYPTYSAKDQERPLEDEDEYSNPSDEEFTYRGFGSVSMAPKIVVQMFTEAKRAEMDLEGLWEARIKRRDDKEAKQDRLFETSVIEQEIQTPGVTRVDGEGTTGSAAEENGENFRSIYRPKVQ